MILVTVGTNEQPFDRLVRAAAALEVDEPLFVQHGSSTVPHGSGEWVDFLPYEQLAERVAEARVVICHAGVGSIMLARRFGRRPLVVPRRIHLGEAVDDHQLPLARQLHASGVVELVEDERALGAAALAAAARPADAASNGRRAGADALAHDLRAYLDGVVLPPQPQPGRSVGVQAGDRG